MKPPSAQENIPAFPSISFMVVGSAKLADSVLGLSVTQKCFISEFPEEKRQQRNAQRKKGIYPGKVFENVQFRFKSRDKLNISFYGCWQGHQAH